MRSREEALLHLRLWPRAGDVKLNKLLKETPSIPAALAARMAADPAGQATMAQRQDAVTRTLRWLEREPDAVLRCVLDADYPAALTNLHDPPPLLLLQGNAALLSRPAVAVVGTRAPSEYGRDVATTLARDLTRAGVVVVSGMARGIDAAAHLGALDAGGDTIAVLASGPDVPTPRQHAVLQRRVRDHGLLVTEFLPGEYARPFHFPRRNRILAGLALAVVVVEAGEGSGALITVEHAQDLGLDVLAVPGPIGRATSEGTNRLLHEGAAVVRDVEDVLAEIAPALGRVPGGGGEADPGTATPPPELAGEALRVWQALSDEGTSLDAVCSWTELPPGRVWAALVELEMRGAAMPLPGTRFVRLAAGRG